MTDIYSIHGSNCGELRLIAIYDTIEQAVTERDWLIANPERHAYGDIYLYVETLNPNLEVLADERDARRKAKCQ